MTLPLLIMLATAHLENAHLVMPAMSHNGGHHACARYQGSPDLQFSAGTNGQHLVDRDLLANIRSNLFYFDLFAGNNLVLLATGFYDRVHISPFDTAALAASNLFHPPEHEAMARLPCKKRRAKDSSTRPPQGVPNPATMTHFL